MRQDAKNAKIAKKCAEKTCFDFLASLALLASWRVVLILLCAATFHVAAASAFANKVTIREDKTLLVDGKPFFPIGLYYAEDEIADASGNLLKDLHETGFNTVFFSSGADV